MLNLLTKILLLGTVLVLSLPGSGFAGIALTHLDTYKTGIFDGSASEIVAYDPGTQRLFVVNANEGIVNILDISKPNAIKRAKGHPSSISLAINVAGDVPGAGGVNSVDVKNGLVAVAVQNADGPANGYVAFYNTDGEPQSFFNGNTENYLEVGNLPDAVKFSHDGSVLIVSNEGEPTEDSNGNPVDPLGSVSLIDITGGVPQSPATTLDFTSFDVAVFPPGLKRQPGTDFSEDAEPEFAAFSPDDTRAFVTLQEINGFAVIDVTNKAVLSIEPLGFKDHSLPGNALDASNRDDAINIRNWPVFGMYQPDGIESFAAGGNTYYITANEGDARDAEEARVKDIDLDPTAFPNAGDLQEDENLGRLNITIWLGDTDGDEDFDQLYSYGARSFSIWDSSGALVYDSGDQFEQITASLLPSEFNSTNDENGSFDNRSDDKGPEPENLSIGVIDSQTYAFIGLERIGGLMVYNVTDPTAPVFVQYINNRNFNAQAKTPGAGDLGPEGVLFISAGDSPNGKPLVAVGNEVSGTTTLYQVNKLD